jgi:hypothetical protein
MTDRSRRRFLAAGAAAVVAVPGARGASRGRSRSGFGVNVRDFGASPASSPAANAHAIKAAARHLRSAAGGGTIFVPRGTYALQGSEVKLPGNIALCGESPSSAYDDVDLAGGTVFSCTTGDYGIFVAGRSVELRNFRITGAGGRCAYGIVVNSIKSVIQNVTSSYFEYGFAGAGLNSNRFVNITAYANSKAGLVVLNGNQGGIGAYQYPKLSGLVAPTGSSVYHLIDCTFRVNAIGVIVLEAIHARMTGGVIESNDQYGFVAFKQAGGNCDGFTLEGVYFENDGREGAPSIAGIEALKTSPSAYLVGDVSGAWNPGRDGGFGVWLGSAQENYRTGGGNYIGGPPSYWTFRDCHIGAKRGGVRVRSARQLAFDNCHLQSMTGAPFFSMTPNAFETTIRDPRSYALDREIAGGRVGGTGTSVILRAR